MITAAASPRRWMQGLLVAQMVAAACAPFRPPPAPAPTRQPVMLPELPGMPVETVVADSSVSSGANPSDARITLTSTNADLRDLLPLLASTAGVNLVMGPEVKGRVSVRFQNVRAIDALNAVIKQADLVVGDPGAKAPWGPTAFYDLPVNIDLASAATIRARFGLTQRLADWIIIGRIF